MSRVTALALGATTLAIAFFGAANAEAFCRTRTCTNEECLKEAGCIAQGIPLFWPASCVTFAVQRGGSARHGIDADRVETEVRQAFDRWLSVDCGGGRRPEFSAQTVGAVSCDTVEYNQDYGNANIVMFRDTEWPPNESGHALALTTVWFNPKTGSIYDADIEINGTTTAITTGAPEAGADLASILTHEVGHFLGLSHSRQNTTMRAFYNPGLDNLRVLQPDDIAGVCELFPAGRAVETDRCRPRHGFASDCRADADEGCAVSGTAARLRPAAGWAGLLGLLVVLGGVRRRFRRQRESV